MSKIFFPSMSVRQKKKCGLAAKIVRASGRAARPHNIYIASHQSDGLFYEAYCFEGESILVRKKNPGNERWVTIEPARKQRIASAILLKKQDLAYLEDLPYTYGFEIYPKDKEIKFIFLERDLELMRDCALFRQSTKLLRMKFCAGDVESLNKMGITDDLVLSRWDGNYNAKDPTEINPDDWDNGNKEEVAISINFLANR